MVHLHETRAQLREFEERDSEPLAIIGASCRYPGGVSSPAELWELVASGTDAIGQFPTDRGWQLERLYHPDPEHPGTSYTRHGGFLYDADRFDAAFFSIWPRRGARDGPPAAPAAGSAPGRPSKTPAIDPTLCRGIQTGVFVGVISGDYGLRSRAVPALEGLRLTGGTASMRVGPRRIHLRPGGPGGLGRHRVLLLAGGDAPRLPGAQGRRVRARAGGRGDGAGHPGCVRRVLAPARPRPRRALQVLLRQRRRHRLGRGLGPAALGAPLAGEGERPPRARADQGLGGQPGRRLERAHGPQRPLPGTRDPPGARERGARPGAGRRRRGPRHRHTLGDPIEAGALLATYGQNRPAGRPLYLGSIKSNIGHTQAAAGVGRA